MLEVDLRMQQYQALTHSSLLPDGKAHGYRKRPRAMGGVRAEEAVLARHSPTDLERGAMPTMKQCGITIRVENREDLAVGISARPAHQSWMGGPDQQLG